MSLKPLPDILPCAFCGDMPKTIENADHIRVCGHYYYRNESLIWCGECQVITARQYMRVAIKNWNKKQSTNQLSIQSEIKKVLRAKAKS